ncbi:MAG: hypothetical protein GX591_14480 [Planctomycetes bacterium]|nr:hypothetical protein [Planctomycetota bacterium]
MARKIATFGWMVVLAAALGAGCGADRRGGFRTAVAQAPTPQAVGATEWLQYVDNLQTTAVVTTYEADGTAMVRTMRLDVDVDSGVVTAEGNLPGGAWSARVTLDGWGVTHPLGIGWVRDYGDLKLTNQEEEDLARTLRLILHRIRGPINLYKGGGEEIVAVENVFVAGYDATRMIASGRPGLALAYYFSDGQLRMIAQGAVEPGGNGEVTVYTTERTAAGAIQPAGFEVMQIGQDSLIGQRKIMAVRLTDVRLD